MALGLIFACIIGLVVTHMARPRFEPRQLSSARFFLQLPPPRKQTPRFRWGSPMDSYPFRLQLFLFLVLLAAIFWERRSYSTNTEETVGFWLLMDTSASMSVRGQGKTRMETAREEALDLLAEIAGEWPGSCLNLSTFDMDMRHFHDQARPTTLKTTLQNLAYRPLGTNINLARALLVSLQEPQESECPITHLVVFSDMPAPDWLTDAGPIQVIWRDVGQVASNVGMTSIHAARDPFTGLVREVRTSIGYFGEQPEGVRFTVTGPDGAEIWAEDLNWQTGPVQAVRFRPNMPGSYRMRVFPGGAYLLDDEAEIHVSAPQPLRFDWQLPSSRLPQGLGWVKDRVNPHFRVVSWRDESDPRPTLFVGGGYASGAPTQIRDFREGHPLLSDLNLDVAESFAMAGVALPAGFFPVLRGDHGRAWLAQRDSPPAVYIPGLPTGGQDDLDRFSTTLFFNAVRRLASGRAFPPLFQLTSPSAPEVSGNRIALHEDEGHTARQPRSSGDINHWQSTRRMTVKKPLWPLLLAVAAFLFTCERGLSTFGGKRWR